MSTGDREARRALALQRAAEEGLELIRTDGAQSGFKNVYANASVTPLSYFAHMPSGTRVASDVPEEVALELARNRPRKPTPRAQSQQPVPPRADVAAPPRQLQQPVPPRADVAASPRQSAGPSISQRSPSNKSPMIDDGLAERRARALQQAANEGLELLRTNKASSGFKHVYINSGGYYATEACPKSRTNQSGYVLSPVAEEVALALARMRQRTASASNQPAPRAAPSAAPVQPPAQPPTQAREPQTVAERREAAILSARAEGLELLPGIGSSGFKGVYKNPAAEGPDVPPFSVLVNRGAAGPVHLGLFRTAEEGALQYARYMRDSMQRGAPAPAPEPATQPGTPGMGSNLGVHKRPLAALEINSLEEGSSASVATPSSDGRASAHKSPSQAVTPSSWGAARSADYVPTRGATVWAKPSHGHWMPAVVLRTLHNGEFLLRWFAEPPGPDAPMPATSIRAFAAELNPDHEKWKRGNHFGYDYGKLKHPTKRAQLKGALRMVDEFEARGGQLSDQPASDEEGEESDGGEGGAEAPHSQALVPKPAYEEDAQIGTMLQQLGLYDRLADRFRRQFDLWNGSSSFDLRYLQETCVHQPKVFAEEAKIIGLRGKDRQAVVAYLRGHGDGTEEPDASWLWFNHATEPRWQT